jgi:hypothetical protein
MTTTSGETKRTPAACNAFAAAATSSTTSEVCQCQRSAEVAFAGPTVLKFDGERYDARRSPIEVKVTVPPRGQAHGEISICRAAPGAALCVSTPTLASWGHQAAM